jgi:hypothetical protein
MLPWDGPGAAFAFVRGLDQQKLDGAKEKGLTFDLMIEARAEGDNAVVAYVFFVFSHLSFNLLLVLTRTMR